MEKTCFIGVALVSSLVAGTAMGGANFSMQFQTHYIVGAPSDVVGGIVGQPETGLARFVNTGTSTFVGFVELYGVAGNGQVINHSVAVTLAAGQSASLLSGPESSNTGGWNRNPAGGADFGLRMRFHGSVIDGTITELVDFTAYDSEIHSGVPRYNPFGVYLDNYVLQGGDPFGRDTGDSYELSQAMGSLDFVQVPAPGALALFAVAGGRSRRRRGS